VALGALAGWLLLLLLLPLLRRGLLDRPNARSAHSAPTPRGGGAAFVLVAAAGSLVGPAAAPPIPMLCLPLALVGLLDDRLNLAAGWRYGVQALTAALLLAITALPLPQGWLRWPLAALLLVAITAVINFFNFMDGLDGLVAASTVPLLAAAALGLGLAWPWPLLGALLGFLRFNWSPARVFMGDVGSTFLGAVFAGLVLQAPTWPQALALLLAATPLLADALICVLRRLLAGQNIFRAHRLHLYQRLQQAGWSHRRVAALYALACAALAGLPLAAAAAAGPELGQAMLLVLVLAVLGLGAALDRVVAVPFSRPSSA
jgi:UDP-N-acetylmuramyl pentapeptide phosphotransferase/UDP-N-acetylglucosamine-1-phosphate transferase